MKRLAVKRMLWLALVSSLATTALVPMPVMAAMNPYRVEVMRAACTTANGLYGYGMVVLKLQAFSYNSVDDGSGTNYFTFNSRRQEKIAGVWTTVEQSVVQSTIFPDKYGEFYFSAINKMRYDFSSPVHPRTRILTQVGFWDEQPGSDIKLNSIGVRTAAC